MTISAFFLHPYTITILGGLAVVFLGRYFLGKSRESSLNKAVVNNNPQQNVNQTVIVNNGQREGLKQFHNENSKLTKRILFVDNDPGFNKMVKILIGAGWKNAKLISDIKNTDSNEIKQTDIFFIDIHGVGIKLTPKDEGLGLAALLKQKYPEKKVVIYSADPDGDRSHPALREIDGFLAKSAEPYQFTNLIESFAGSESL